MTTTIENMATTFYDKHHNVLALKNILKERGLQTGGRKKELVSRLVKDDLEKESWRVTESTKYLYFFAHWGKQSVRIYRLVDGSCKYVKNGYYALLQIEPFHNNDYRWEQSDDRVDSLCCKVVSKDKLDDNVIAWQSQQAQKFAAWSEQ
jgi:hypothetical protein